MSTTTELPNKIHIGRNIKRFREILGVKQEALAIELGEDWNQKRISMMESKPNIDVELLDQIAKALKIPVEAIKNFDEEKTVMNIQNNFEGANQGAGAATINSGPINGESTTNNECSFNPLDKLMETVEELKALYADNKELYERLLQKDQELLDSERALLKSEREKNELMKGKAI